MRKRLIRVVPLYWVLTLFLAAVAVMKPEVLATTVFDCRHFVASMLFIPWQHPQIGAMLPLLIPGWTLNYEMAFYVMFAAAWHCRNRSACGRCWPCLPGWRRSARRCR